MTLAELYEKRGMEKGMQLGMRLGMRQGIQQGMQESKRLIALRLIAKKYNIIEVSEITELSLQEIITLQKTETTT